MHNGFVASPAPTFPLLPPPLNAEHDAIWCGHFVSAVPSVSPPNSLCTPSLLTVAVVREVEEIVTFCNY